MNTKYISKPNFHKDLDKDFKFDMKLSAEVDFDLSIINDFIKSLIFSKQRENIVKARDIVDNFISVVERISDDK